MSFFDPAHEKILQKAPPSFAIMMRGLDSRVVQELRAGGVPENGLNLSRNIIYAGVLAAAHHQFGGCSHDCMEFASRTGANAAKLFPKQLWPVVAGIMETIVLGLDEAESEVD